MSEGIRGDELETCDNVSPAWPSSVVISITERCRAGNAADIGIQQNPGAGRYSDAGVVVPNSDRRSDRAGKADATDDSDIGYVERRLPA